MKAPVRLWGYIPEIAIIGAMIAFGAISGQRAHLYAQAIRALLALD